MDTDWVRIGSDWAQFAVAGGCGGALALWASLGRRNRVLEQRLAELTASIGKAQAGHADRITRLESAGPGPQCATHAARLAVVETTLATADPVGAHRRIDALVPILSKVEGTLMRIERMVDLLTEHQMHHGPREGDRR